MTRIDDVITKVERGEPVDVRQTLALMALDLAASDHRFVVEAVERTKAADDGNRREPVAG